MSKELEHKRTIVAQKIKNAAEEFSKAIIEGQENGLSMTFNVTSKHLTDKEEPRAERLMVIHDSDKRTTFSVDEIKATNEY